MLNWLLDLQWLGLTNWLGLAARISVKGTTDGYRIVSAVGSRNGTEETKLMVLDFDVHDNNKKE